MWIAIMASPQCYIKQWLVATKKAPQLLNFVVLCPLNLLFSFHTIHAWTLFYTKAQLHPHQFTILRQQHFWAVLLGGVYSISNHCIRIPQKKVCKSVISSLLVVKRYIMLLYHVLNRWLKINFRQWLNSGYPLGHIGKHWLWCYNREYMVAQVLLPAHQRSNFKCTWKYVLLTISD